MKFWTLYHSDNCVLWPAAQITAGRCENPDCAKVHGFRFGLSWLWWSAGLDIPLSH